MRVLVVHNSYGAISGEEVLVDELCRNLHDQNVELFRYILPCESAPQNLLQKLISFLTGIYNVKTLFKLRGFIKANQIDVVHIHNVYPWISFAVVDACKIAGVPVVATVHNYRMICPSATLFNKGQIYFEGLRNLGFSTVLDNVQGDHFKSLGYWLRFLQFKLFRYEKRIDKFLFISEFQKQLVLEHSSIPEDKSEVIYNPLIKPIEPEDVSTQTTKDQYPERISILFVGRVVKEKGAELIIELARQYLQEKRDTIFLFAGGVNPDDPFVMAAPSNCRFLGLVDRKRLFELMSRVDVVVNPSLWHEPFGMSFIEAAYFGRKVLTTNLGALEELSSGLPLVASVSPEKNELYKSLESLLEQEISVQQLDARKQSIKDQFSSLNWILKQLNVYQSLISK